MYCKKSSRLVFVIGFSILTILGCGGDTDDLMLKDELIGYWGVVSVKDVEPSRFLTVLLVNEENEDILLKAAHHDFFYFFIANGSWGLEVIFDVLPNPAPNGIDKSLGLVVGTWKGTYQVLGDTLTLTIETEAVKVTPTNEFFEEITGTTKAELQVKLTDKFRMSLINPFDKTFIEINDFRDISGFIGSELTLTIPGSPRGQMRLEKLFVTEAFSVK